MSKFSMAAVAIALPLVFASAAMAQNGAMPDRAPMDRAAAHQMHCTDHYAHQAARLTYLEAKLNLTDKQRPLWNAWRDARLASAAQMRDACQAEKIDPASLPTAVDRETRMEAMLKINLSGLENSKPALQALYASLNPDQKAVLDHPMMRGGHGFGHHGFGGHGPKMGGMPGPMGGMPEQQ